MKIGIDMDGTIADFVREFCQRVRQTWPIDLDPREITEFGKLETLTYARLYDSLASNIELYADELAIEEATMEIVRKWSKIQVYPSHPSRLDLADYLMPFSSSKEVIAHICTEGFFKSLLPLEGAVEGVKLIAQHHEVIFISKAINWNFCAAEKSAWLSKHFDGVDYKVVFVDSMASKGLFKVDVLVDDDPKAFQDVCAETTPIMIYQPWNAQSKTRAISAQNMLEVAQIVDVLGKVSNLKKSV
jgi:5'(3')-deoxyribonucleotidase